jgi:hypothetical protein
LTRLAGASPSATKTGKSDPIVKTPPMKEIIKSTGVNLEIFLTKQLKIQ